MDQYSFVITQALQYLLKLCSHPLLVIGESPPDYIVEHLKEIGMGTGDELHELHHSPKLVALQEILQECGIGSDISSPDASAAVGQHRVLIFAQHKVLSLFLCHVPLSLLFLSSDFILILFSTFSVGFPWHYWEGSVSVPYEKVSFMSFSYLYWLYLDMHYFLYSANTIWCCIPISSRWCKLSARTLLYVVPLCASPSVLLFKESCMLKCFRIAAAELSNA